MGQLVANARGGKPPRTADEVVGDAGMAQVTDDAVIEAVCRAVLDANPRQVAALRGGKRALFGFFVGLVMKETRGSASPANVNATLERMLEAG